MEKIEVNIQFEQVLAFVNQTAKNIFLTGKAGTGKTTLLRYIKSNTYKQMAIVAPTGVAAINAGGVGIGGVLEPVQAAPVIIEDGCFIGSRAIVVEGVRVCSEAVLGANVVLTGSTRIIDVTGPEPKEMKGIVPPRCVVIPGTVPKKFAAGEYGVPCALIIGQRKESTDKKTSLNEALREHNVAV